MVTMDPNQYTVGWICPVDKELIAARAVLDKEHDPPSSLPRNDNNTYCLGEVGPHNVVIASLPMYQYGTTTAARVAGDLLHSFPNVRIGLLVGIGGGVPTRHDIRLGDVVVSAPGYSNPGVHQYDYGTAIQGRGFVSRGTLNQAPMFVLTAVQALKADFLLKGNPIVEDIRAALNKYPALRETFSRPDSATDRLYQADYVHEKENEDCAVCCRDVSRLVSREDRPASEAPRVHHGLIASANNLMQDATIRDELSHERDVFCFEMEAAGLSNHFPCIVIRGICDYADSHKALGWQGFAALAAASYAKQLVLRIAPTAVQEEVKMVEHIIMLRDGLSNAMAPLNQTLQAVQALNTESSEQRRREVLRWFSKVDFTLRHKTITDKRLDGVGQWFIDSNEFQSWLQTKRPTLFCNGLPGVGKTFISSWVIDHLRILAEQSAGTRIAYAYFEFERRHEQDPSTVLSSLVKQLADPGDTLPKAVEDLFTQHNKGQTRPSFTEISDAFRSVVDLIPKVFIVLDALDEFEAPLDDTRKLLEAVCQPQERAVKKVFFTSRPRWGLDTQSICGGDCPVEIRADDQDISNYIRWRISRDKMRVIGGELAREVTDRVMGVPDQLLLYVKLQMNTLLDLPTKGDVTEALQSLQTGTEGLAQLFQRELERIDNLCEPSRGLVYRMLAWIVFSNRPLSLLELQHAVAVRDNLRSMNPKFIPKWVTMQILSTGLVDIDTKRQIPRLIHRTVHDFLRQNLAKWFPEPLSYIFQTCAIYLAYEAFGRGPCSSNKDYEARARDNPLFEYAAQNWGYHAAKISLDSLDDVEFLKSRRSAASSVQSLMTKDAPRWDDFSRKFPSEMTKLHLAAYFGIDEVVRRLSRRSRLLNFQDSYGRTPLWYAAQQGSRSTVDILLSRDKLLVNRPDSRDLTPLYIAVAGGHELVVKSLAKSKDIDLNYPPDEPPLARAAEEGHEAIVKILLDTKKVDIDAADGCRFTALLHACMKGHTGIVRHILNTKKADLDTDDGRGDTPFTWAVRHNFVDIVRILLRQPGIKFDRWIYGRTSLAWAAMERCEDMFFVLLNSGTINVKDGVSPLADAAASGSTRIVQALVNMKEVDINEEDEDGGAPLFNAIRAGHYDVVEQLLKTGRLNLDATGFDDMTALDSAKKEGNQKLLQLFSKYTS